MKENKKRIFGYVNYKVKLNSFIQGDKFSEKALNITTRNPVNYKLLELRKLENVLIDLIRHNGEKIAEKYLKGFLESNECKFFR